MPKKTRIKWDDETTQKLVDLVRSADSVKLGCDLAAKEFGQKPGSIMTRFYEATKTKKRAKAQAVASEMFLVTVTNGNKTSKRVVSAQDVQVERVEAIL